MLFFWAFLSFWLALPVQEETHVALFLFNPVRHFEKLFTRCDSCGFHLVRHFEQYEWVHFREGGEKEKKKSHLFGGHGSYQAELFLPTRAMHFDKRKCLPPDLVGWPSRITFFSIFPMIPYWIELFSSCACTPLEWSIRKTSGIQLHHGWECFFFEEYRNNPPPFGPALPYSSWN